MNDADFGQLMQGIERAEPQAWQALMQLVYSDLKRIAHRQLARVDPGQTLSTTVLVHETFEKLAANGGLPVRERADFYALCAHAMRQILIDHYRRRGADKRAAQPAALAEHEECRATGDIDAALLDLGRGLDLLARHDPRLLQVFEMRYFGGLSDIEIGRRLDLAERSVQRQVARARAWVMACLDEPESIP
jgi:RNA polymerase sigma factor (TIGR02999 family)